MRIGNYPQRGEALKVGKWYFLFELRKCPDYMFRVFRPELTIGFTKCVDEGEMGKLGGRLSKYIGFHKHFVFPFSIRIEISR